MSTPGRPNGDAPRAQRNVKQAITRPAALRGRREPAHRLPLLALAVQGRDRFSRLTPPLPTDRTLRRWVRQAVAAAPAAAAPIELTLRFVDAREGRRLNREFRGRDYATNVLTFDYTRAPLCADIVLCVPVVVLEAKAQRKLLRAHLAHLVVHGVLHAQGHDHETEREAARMEALEVRLLGALGYPDPYAGAAA